MRFIEVRYVEERDDEPRHAGKIGLWIGNEYCVDASVILEELFELRAEIDRFLFLRVAGPRKGEK